MECEKLGELGLEGLLLLKNSGLVGQDCTDVKAKGLYVLGDKDAVLLGLIPECMKTISEGEHQVL